MPNKPIVFDKFLRGVCAGFSRYGFPKGSVRRISNFIFTSRGKLRPCDGSLALWIDQALGRSGLGPWLVIAKSAILNGALNGVKIDANTLLSAPSLTSATISAGGTLINGTTYFYMITALDGGGGETTVSNEVSATPAGGNNSIILVWPAKPQAGGFNVYRSTTAGIGSKQLIFTLPNAAPFLTGVTDSGAIPFLISPPVANTTEVCRVMQLADSSAPVTFTEVGATIALVPRPPLIPYNSTLGFYGSTDVAPIQPGITTSKFIGSETPCGGVVGGTCPIPLIVYFANLTILLLGNGYPPQVITNVMAALTNTFTITYPDWITATTYQQGDIIFPTSNNPGGDIFTAVQGGVSGAVRPNFPATKGQQVGDGSVIWQNTGFNSSTPAPRGAAHALPYAGSLWLFNTSPFTTSDGLDGPSCLKMSDVNNANSWNPLNTAFIGRDDGTQGMGMATFTIQDTGIAPTASLILFKEFSTFQLIGVLGASNVLIQQIQTEMGCLAPRSIKFVPGFGVIRYTHLGFAVFDGSKDRVVSEDLRPYLFQDPDEDTDITPVDWGLVYFSKGDLASNPPLYMCAMPLQGNTAGFMTRVFCYDLVLRAWTIIDLPFAISAMYQERIAGTQPITLFAGADDGNIRRVCANDTIWDSGGVITSTVQLPPIASSDGTQRMHYHKVYVRGTGAQVPLNSGAVPVTIKPTYDGVDDVTQTPQFEVTQGVNPPLYMADLALERIGTDLILTVTVVSNGFANVPGPGIDAIVVEAEPLPIRAPITIA